MRVDRIASIHGGHLTARVLTRRVKSRIPILMYHSICDELGGRHPYYETNTSAQVFEQQMRYLNENEYSPLSLDGAIDWLQSPLSGQKPVVITFDDGYRDFYTAAYPVLGKYGLTATVFVVSGFTCDQAIQFKGRHCLTWKEVKVLRSNGIQIGSHTVTHPELELLQPARIDDEIGRSKQTIEDRIGEAVKSFSYPYAFPESNRPLIASVSRTLKKHGYENGVSTILGTAGQEADRFFLPRLPINSWDDPRFFRAKLEGGYDWMHLPQSVCKRVRRHASEILTLTRRKKGAVEKHGSWGG
jgi:peptidoglycan/xylan/chitin deacetylase (PgdA/CDA1 family)